MHPGQQEADSSAWPWALVCGLTVHGLAVARALARHGVTVHAFAQGAGWQHPTSLTRYAKVHVRRRLNREDLLQHLRDFAGGLPAGRKVVLFPTSDRMAATIARHWDELSGHYLLSWAHCRDLVLSMQLKENLPGYAQRSNIRYPRTETISRPEDAPLVAARLELPVVVKPSRPLSTFKAIIAREGHAIEDIARRYPGDLPFVAQEFIEGGEGTLYACTMYLDGGREICAMTSRKLAASPPGLGQGTVFSSESIPEVINLTRQFLAGMDLSGPVALEFKRDGAGRYWMIEPNVGRTEYCVDLAIQSGVNLPCIEFRHAAGLPFDPTLVREPSPHLWFDTDKDPFCYVNARTILASTGAAAHRPVFPFAGHGDPLPLLAATARQAVGTVRQGVSDLWSRIGSRKS